MRIQSILKITVLVFCLSVFTQGCGLDSYATEGNGHPYEGLSGGTAERDPASAPEPAQDVQDGGALQKPFVVHYRCTNPESAHLNKIRFGVRPNGNHVVIVRLLDGTGFETNWVEDAEDHAILRDVDNLTTLLGIDTTRGLDHEDGGVAIARYKSKLFGTYGEVFNCENMLDTEPTFPIVQAQRSSD